MPVRAADPARVHAALARRGVTSIRWWSGYHRALPWDEFPEACALKDTIVALPVHQDLDDDAVDRVADALSMA
jgi:dTDP-4-amino-4,6-dideoxygalactose transaminase